MLIKRSFFKLESILYQFYKNLKGSFLGPLVMLPLRKCRVLFWKYRPSAYKIESISSDFLNFVQSEIQGKNFKLIEIGCNSGNTLFALKKAFPDSSFAGIDLNIEAIKQAKQYIELHQLPQMNIFQSHLIDPKVDYECDYLISRTVLIYLNEVELKKFLSLILKKIRKKILLQEIISKDHSTIKTSYFAHPLPQLIKAIPFSKDFNLTVLPLSYGPWSSRDHQGANLVLSRKT